MSVGCCPFAVLWSGWEPPGLPLRSVCLSSSLPLFFSVLRPSPAIEGHLRCSDSPQLPPQRRRR